MSDIPGRIFNIAKSYLDAAKDRLAEIDTAAQTELDKAMSHDDFSTPAPSDPMERARQKIARTQGENTARQEMPPPGVSDVPDPMQIAYKVIGVPQGSDYLTVESAVNKLRERVDPSKFPSGSQEQAEAKIIGERVEEAFRTLRASLDPNAGRFDRLEI